MIQEHQSILLPRDAQYLRNQVQVSGKVLQLLSSRGWITELPTAMHPGPQTAPAAPEGWAANPAEGKGPATPEGDRAKRGAPVPMGGFLQGRGKRPQQGQLSAQEGSAAPPAGFWFCSQGEELRNPKHNQKNHRAVTIRTSHEWRTDKNERTKEYQSSSLKLLIVLNNTPSFSLRYFYEKLQILKTLTLHYP